MNLAVIIPAYNEEKTISNVIKEFQQALPEAQIYVGNNRSQDSTAQRAKEAGAEVIFCHKKGKGHTVRKLLEDIDADIFIMIDADETYSAANVRELIEPILHEEADMVIGTRKQVSKRSFSISHRIGNKILTFLLNTIFKVKLKDVLSGYRVINRKIVDDLVLLAKGFELEVEITIRALQEGHNVIDVPIDYRQRPEGSESKLSTWGDGFLILYTIVTLFRDYNPMGFFGLASIFFFIIGLISGLDVLVLFILTGEMYHIGLAILTALCILLSAIIFMMGVLLDSLNNSWRLTQRAMQQNRLLIKKTVNNNSRE